MLYEWNNETLLTLREAPVVEIPRGDAKRKQPVLLLPAPSNDLQQELRDQFYYLEHEPCVLWRKKKGREPKVQIKSKYRTISINKRRMTVHRAVWIYHNGNIPKNMIIQHINGDTHDNRIENLRMVKRGTVNPQRIVRRRQIEMFIDHFLPTIPMKSPRYQLIRRAAESMGVDLIKALCEPVFRDNWNKAARVASSFKYLDNDEARCIIRNGMSRKAWMKEQQQFKAA